MWGTKDCRHCGKEKVDERHICKGRLQYLSHVCTWCGEVSDDPEKLCTPEEIDDLKRANWKEINNKKNDDISTCKGCHQPIQGKGHICDPKLPYTCNYCNEKISTTHHVCKEIVENAKYVCNVCGRLTIEQEGVCAPKSIE